MAQTEPPCALDLWRDGVEFSFAWHKFADADAQKTFASADTQDAILARRIMMVVDLWARLSDGELIAFGDRIAPTISDGPAALPSRLFLDPPPIGIGGDDVIAVSGWRYERVRVCPADALEIGGQPTAGPAPKRGGRRDTYPFSVEVLRHLYLSESKQRLSAEKLHPEFAAEFERRFPYASHNIPAPEVRTLQKQIIRYRQEQAGTGNN